MIKRYSINKFVVATFSLLLICIISLLPSNEEFNIEVEENNESNSVIYLIDDDNYVSKLSIFIDKNTIEDIIKEKLVLLRDGSENYINFNTVIPKDTIINNIVVKESSVYIDFSKEFLSVKSDKVESMIEAIVYSLTEINGINDIYINIDGELLKEFPNNDYILEQPFNRSIGINKEYDIVNLNNITKTTMYFVKESNENSYFVPVTKVSNDNSEKISIIINELKSSTYSMDNLGSYLSNDLILEEYNKTEDTINLIFNDYIFNSIGSKDIIEEVKYTIGMSILENYDVKEVIFSTKSENNITSYSEK